MKHKSIINLISSFFFLGILFALASIVMGYTVKPEIIFNVFFAIMIFGCILIFKVSDYLDKKHKDNNLTNVIDQDLYLFKSL